MKTRKFIASDFGYKGDEILIHPETGSKGTANQWSSEVNDWLVDCDDEDCDHSFDCSRACTEEEIFEIFFSLEEEV